MTDMVEKWRLDEANVRIAAYARLAGDIAYGLRTGMSPTAFRLRVETLPDDFFPGSSAAVPPAGVRRSPVDGGAVGGAAVPGPWRGTSRTAR